VWAPALGLYGIQRIHLLRDVVILGGAGVGGGSLNYANTLYKPLAPFFADPQWAGVTDWEDELEAHYDQARRMLGVTMNPTVTEADKVIKRVADDMGVGGTFTLTPVGVLFGDAGDKPGTEVEDPYHRLYGHPGIHVADGSTVSANLGVNPSLTITAQAERAMSFWPNRGEPDPRPAVGSVYRRLAPFPPIRPAVPTGAPAALRTATAAPSSADSPAP